MIDTSKRREYLDLFDIPLGDYKNPENICYYKLSPDSYVYAFKSSSGKFFVFYVEDFPKPYETICSLVERWWGSRIVKTITAKHRTHNAVVNEVSKFAAHDPSRVDTIFLFEVEACPEYTPKLG